MSVKLAQSSLLGALWRGSSPTTQPNGLLLELAHEQPAEGSFTAFAFNPSDNTRFVFGDSTGAIFHVMMKKNKYVVAARLATGAPVTSLVYVSVVEGSAAEGASFVLAASAAQLHLVDIESGRIAKRVLRTPHASQITQIIVNPFKKNFAVTVSSDCVALWDVDTLKCSHHTSERGHGNRGTLPPNAPPPTAFSNFVSAAIAISRTEDGRKEHPYRHEEGEGTVDQDSHARSNGTKQTDVSAVGHASALLDGPPTAEHILVTLEAGGFLTIWSLSNDFRPLKRVDTAPYRPTAAMAVCETFIVVGTQQGKLLCFSTDLDAISSVNVPGGSAIVSVELIDGRVIGCQLANGTTWFIRTADYSVLFSLSYPSPTAPKKLAAADATYSAAVTHSTIYIHHLPTAKAHYNRTITGTSAQGKMREQSVLYPFAKTNKEGDGELRGSSAGSRLVNRGHQQNGASSMAAFSESVSVPLPRQILRVEDANVKEWIKVNLITGPTSAGKGGGVSISSPQTLLLVDAVRSMTKDEVSEAYRSGKGTSTVSSGTARRGGSSSSPRGTGTSSSTSRAISRNGGRADLNNNKKKKAQEDEAAVISLRGFLDHDSRVINMDKLRALLVRYGAYPDRYRPLIWRFLLQLPEKRFTEAQFANLVARGPHPAVRTLMAPFPLPETKLRNTLYNTLSVLAWHSPVFSAVHFIPNILFPFVKLYSSDVQSSVEVFLAFLVNWGQEFFVYYPHPPVSVVSFVAHTLKLLSPELHEHFAANGVGTDVYVWDVMCSLYTELLTRNEWLQVMDHAFANEPVWLLLFHVCLLGHLKDPLMSLNDHAQIVAVLRRPTPLNLPLVIQNAYQLQRTYVQSDLSHPYRHFNTFINDAYPLVMECNEAVITSRVRELEKIQSHESQILNMRDRIAQIKKQLVQAAMLEDAFVGRQKAIVCSQFEATNDIWAQQVQLEKERQKLRDIEHETRLGALQEQLRSAHRIEAMQQEIYAAAASTRDAEIDRQREVMKWDFGDRMANQEIERLEAGARMKLASVVRSAELLAEAGKAQQQQFVANTKKMMGMAAAAEAESYYRPELTESTFTAANGGAGAAFSHSYENYMFGGTDPSSGGGEDPYVGVINSKFPSARVSQVHSATAAVPPPPFPHEISDQTHRSGDRGEVSDGLHAKEASSNAAKNEGVKFSTAAPTYQAAQDKIHAAGSEALLDAQNVNVAKEREGNAMNTTTATTTTTNNNYIKNNGEFHANDAPPSTIYSRSPPRARGEWDESNVSTNHRHLHTYSTSNTFAERSDEKLDVSRSIASDPVGYYRALQEELKRGMAVTKRDQQATIASLNSRYARALLHDDDETLTDVTEPVCDDVGIDENANNNLGALPRRPLPPTVSSLYPPLSHRGGQVVSTSMGAAPANKKIISSSSSKNFFSSKSNTVANSNGGGAVNQFVTAGADRASSSDEDVTIKVKTVTTTTTTSALMDNTNEQHNGYAASRGGQYQIVDEKKNGSSSSTKYIHNNTYVAPSPRTYSHSKATETAARALAAAARYERSADVGSAASQASETTQSSSMTRAILRPHERGYFNRK